MDSVQKACIDKNLVELIKNTTCSAQLLSILQQSGILSQSDYEDVGSMKTPFEKSRRLYEILPTRNGAFQILENALESVKQSGALRLLQQSEAKFQDFGLISVDLNYELGKGRSTVYRGKFDGREVAVKVIREDLDQALKEVEILKKLDDHENIVRYFIAEQKSDKLYVALELCLVNLEDELKMRLVKSEPIQLLERCTRGLAFLHKNGIIHRDLKPSNILLNRLGQVKISDFGFSKQLSVGMSAISVSGVCGTLDWMAPEILGPLQGGPSTVRNKTSTKSDIFSLGCIFYFVLSNGKHLFGDGFKRPQNIIDNAPQWGNVPLDDSTTGLIRKMISRLPNQRPSAEETLSFEYFCKSSGSGTTRPNQNEKSRMPVDKCLDSNSLKCKPDFVEPIKSKTPERVGQQTTKGITVPVNSTIDQIRHHTIKARLDPERVVFRPTVVKPQANSSIDVPMTKNTITTEDLSKLKTEVNMNEVIDRIARKMEIPKWYKRKMALMASMDINAVLYIGRTLLHHAAWAGESVDCLASLIELGCDWKAKTENEETVLHFAADGGNFLAIKYFVTLGADVDARTRFMNEAPIHYAIRTKVHFLETIRELVTLGANINATALQGYNLVFQATLAGRHPSDLEEIVRLGGDWKTKGPHDNSILHFAVLGGNVDVVKYFVELGADVNSKNSSCSTPLHMVADLNKRKKSDAIQILHFLLENGADINAKDIHGHSVLGLAKHENTSSELIDEIIKAGGK